MCSSDLFPSHDRFGYGDDSKKWRKDNYSKEYNKLKAIKKYTDVKNIKPMIEKREKHIKLVEPNEIHTDFTNLQNFINHEEEKFWGKRKSINTSTKKQISSNRGCL